MGEASTPERLSLRTRPCEYPLRAQWVAATSSALPKASSRVGSACFGPKVCLALRRTPDGSQVSAEVTAPGPHSWDVWAALRLSRKL